MRISSRMVYVNVVYEVCTFVLSTGFRNFSSGNLYMSIKFIGNAPNARNLYASNAYNIASGWYYSTVYLVNDCALFSCRCRHLCLVGQLIISIKERLFRTSYLFSGDRMHLKWEKWWFVSTTIANTHIEKQMEWLTKYGMFENCSKHTSVCNMLLHIYL